MLTRMGQAPVHRRPLPLLQCCETNCEVRAAYPGSDNRAEPGAATGPAPVIVSPAPQLMDILGLAHVEHRTARH